MLQPTRLFDCINLHLKSAPDRTMLAGKENGQWREYSTREVAGIVNRLSASLMKMGFGKGDGTEEGRDKIGVIAKNRPEWVMLDLAVQKIGAVLVPVYPTINDLELEYILKDSRVKIMFTNDQALTEKVAGVKNNLPDLKDIYSFDKVEGANHWEDILVAEKESDF